MERTKLGLNRTGIKANPIESARMLEVPELTRPSSEGDGLALIAQKRVDVSAESETMGTLPPPASVKELATTAVKMLTGKKAPIFIDKLGERLAFERSGTRLYDAAISKFDAFGSWAGGPTREELVHIRNEELRHFHLLHDVIESLGSDPTAVTPSANIVAVASKGLFLVCTDPRTSLHQTLEAILIAELSDNDCWENLIDLAETMGRDDLAAEFAEALDNEREHLRNVRMWLASALSEEATHRKMAGAFASRSAKRQTAMIERNQRFRGGSTAGAKAGKSASGRIARKAASARTAVSPRKKATAKKKKK